MARMNKRNDFLKPGRAKTDPLLTVREVAELDGCSEKTVRRAIAAGLLDVVRIGPGGRLMRIDPADHRAYRAANRG